VEPNSSQLCWVLLTRHPTYKLTLSPPGRLRQRQAQGMLLPSAFLLLPS